MRPLKAALQRRVASQLGNEILDTLDDGGRFDINAGLVANRRGCGVTSQRLLTRIGCAPMPRVRLQQWARYSGNHDAIDLHLLRQTLHGQHFPTVDCNSYVNNGQLFR
eukprot:801102-Amphidinium_carterae.1